MTSQSRGRCVYRKWVGDLASPVCRNLTCWDSRSLLVLHGLRPLNTEVCLCAPALLWSLSFSNTTLNWWEGKMYLLLKSFFCCCFFFLPDVEVESEAMRWSRERREKRQARARRKAQRSGEARWHTGRHNRDWLWLKTGVYISISLTLNIYRGQSDDNEPSGEEEFSGSGLDPQVSVTLILDNVKPLKSMNDPV